MFRYDRLSKSFTSVNTKPYLAAVIAVLLWASQASLTTLLSQVPPFLLTSLALIFGGLPALPKLRSWSRSPAVYGIGIYGVFVYHFLYFLALRKAPAVEANLVQYLWPSLIVLLTPLFFKGMRVRANHLIGVVLGFSGSALVILAGESTLHTGFHIGYVYALGAAIVWATFSLSLKKLPPHSTWTIGGICLISGLLSLGLHMLLEQPASLALTDVGLIALQGLGPMGCAFYLWSFSLQHGDSRIVGILAYAIPVLSTLLLIVVTHRNGNTIVLASALLVVVGGLVGLRSPRTGGQTFQGAAEEA